MNMRDMLKNFFENEKIEYYSVLRYSDITEINPAIRERSGIAAESIIIYLLPYYVSDGENISAYATSLDYHIAIRELNERLISLLSEAYPAGSFRGFGDHSPIDECGAALAAGLGIIGDNGLIINEKYGSYIFIGDIITDVPPEELGASAPMQPRSCSSCGRCAAACPTGILRGEGSECLSYITQKKGELLDDEKELMRRFGTAWGCDICQKVCPHNKSAGRTPLEFFEKRRMTRLSSELVEKLEGKSFKERAFAWRGKNTVLRNTKILENEE